MASRVQKNRRLRRRAGKRNRTVLLETLEPRLLLNSDWQNPFDRLDVNDDGHVTPLDALIGINDLNARGSRALPARAESEVGSPPFLDVNGDGANSPADVLVVVSQLNATALAEGEASTPVDRADLVNLDAETDTTLSGIFHNRRTRQSKTNLTVTNISAVSIDAPLVLVIESISDPTVIVANADGTVTPDGKPYFDLTGQVPGDQLDAGESTNNRPLVFDNPNLRPFTIQTSVYRQQVTPLAPSVTLEILADPPGRKFIGVGEGLDVTVRADGSDPVTVDLGQKAAADGSRGIVFFGADSLYRERRES
jgi:hypothetical protein